MFKHCYIEVLFTLIIYASATNDWNGYRDSNYKYECGPYGFTCERNNRMRLCDETDSTGPAFVCPLGTFCNEESTDVCEDAVNHIDPLLLRKIRCHRYERIANPIVPGCKGYILCVPNGGRFQAINFKCSGNTVFNGLTRTCTSPNKYKCPQGNTTKYGVGLYGSDNHRDPSIGVNKPTSGSNIVGHRHTSIECKDYKFRVRQDESPVRATYFCPPRPVRGQDSIRCTIFSNYFCITLDRDDFDQYIHDTTPSRKPRYR